MAETKIIILIFLVPFISCNSCTSEVNETLKAEAKEYLKYMDTEETKFAHDYSVLSWAFQTNVTDENLKKWEDFKAQPSKIKILVYPWTEFDDPDMLRQASLYGLLVPDDMYKKSFNTSVELGATTDAMIESYSTLTLCSYNNRSICNISFSPTLNVIFGNSRDPDELEYYWIEYHDQLSLRIKENYSKYVKLSNEYSHYFNFSSTAEMWISKEYENQPPYSQFEDAMKDLYDQLKPLYLQLHAFVRARLYDFYGECVVNKTGPIPVHLTGTLAGLTFHKIIDIIKPYPNKPTLDITPELQKQKYTVRKMAGKCDEFFYSLGLPLMNDNFWNNSQFERPKDRVSTCITSAWDMFANESDFRLLTCAAVTFFDWQNLCHEMGHVQHYFASSNLPYCYRNELNSAIAEGWADVPGFSISTVKHLSKLGLMEDEIDIEIEINNLFYSAIEKVVFLPYSLILDVFRWDYFKGNVTDDTANSHWWDLRLKYQGMAPPKPRSNKVLDILDKSHVVFGDTYIKYFLSHIIQFQMHQSLCITAGEFDPNDPKSQTLDKCDISGSKEAGALVKKMLNLGASKPWLEVLKAMTGQSKVDASSILNYYGRLFEWLKNENKKQGNAIGW